MDKQPLLHASLLLPLRWEKEHNETRLSLGVLTTLCGDYDYPAVAMPTVMSFLYHSICVDFFPPFLQRIPYSPVPGSPLGAQLQSSCYLRLRETTLSGDLRQRHIVLMGKKSWEQLPGCGLVYPYTLSRRKQGTVFCLLHSKLQTGEGHMVRSYQLYLICQKKITS